MSFHFLTSRLFTYFIYFSTGSFNLNSTPKNVVPTKIKTGISPLFHCIHSCFMSDSSNSLLVFHFCKYFMNYFPLTNSKMKSILASSRTRAKSWAAGGSICVQKWSGCSEKHSASMNTLIKLKRFPFTFPFYYSLYIPAHTCIFIQLYNILIIFTTICVCKSAFGSNSFVFLSLVWHPMCFYLLHAMIITFGLVFQFVNQKNIVAFK